MVVRHGNGCADIGLQQPKTSLDSNHFAALAPLNSKFPEPPDPGRDGGPKFELIRKRPIYTVKGRGGSSPLLYGADRLKQAAPGDVVMIVEGEKKVDALRQRGVLAVSADSGANSKWSEIDVSSLAPFQIVIWPDSDGRLAAIRTNWLGC